MKSTIYLIIFIVAGVAWETSLGMFKGHQTEGVFSHVHCSEDNAGREMFIRDVQRAQARGRFFACSLFRGQWG